MFFLIRTAAIGALVYGLFVWGFDARVSWTWYILTTCVVGTLSFIGAISVNTVKWVAIMTIINDLLWDRTYR